MHCRDYLEVRMNGSKERMGLGFCERKEGVSFIKHFSIKERDSGL
jgi:hypothetical protein